MASRGGGPLHIAKLEDGSEVKVYNLVVDGSHTYFIGDERVFTHDPTFAEPVDVTVPGLPWFP